MTDTFERIKRIALNLYDDADMDVDRDTDLLSDLKFDSLELVELEMELEDEFDLVDCDCSSWQTLGDVEDYVTAAVADRVKAGG